MGHLQSFRRTFRFLHICIVSNAGFAAIHINLYTLSSTKPGAGQSVALSAENELHLPTGSQQTTTSIPPYPIDEWSPKVATTGDTYGGEALDNAAGRLSDRCNVDTDKVPSVLWPTMEIQPTDGVSRSLPEPYPSNDMLIEYHKDHQEQSKSITYNGELPHEKCATRIVSRDEK